MPPCRRLYVTHSQIQQESSSPPCVFQSITSKGVQAFALCLSHGYLIFFTVDVNSSNSSDNFLKSFGYTKSSATYTYNTLIYTVTYISVISPFGSSHHHQMVRKTTANTSSPHSCSHGSITTKHSSSSTAHHPRCQWPLPSVCPAQCWMR